MVAQGELGEIKIVSNCDIAQQNMLHANLARSSAYSTSMH